MVWWIKYSTCSSQRASDLSSTKLLFVPDGAWPPIPPPLPLQSARPVGFCSRPAAKAETDGLVPEQLDFDTFQFGELFALAEIVHHFRRLTLISLDELEAIPEILLDSALRS